MVAELGFGGDAVGDGAEADRRPDPKAPQLGENVAAPVARVEPDWTLVRADYEGDVETVDAVAAKHGITKGRLLYQARARGWRPRNRHHGGGAASLLLRLFRLLERQIHQMESEGAPMGEKEAAALGKVAATLEKLIEIERASAPRKAARTQSKDLQTLRKKVAERFAQLSRP